MRGAVFRFLLSLTGFCSTGFFAFNYLNRVDSDGKKYYDSWMTTVGVLYLSSLVMFCTAHWTVTYFLVWCPGFGRHEEVLPEDGEHAIEQENQRLLNRDYEGLRQRS